MSKGTIDTTLILCGHFAGKTVKLRGNRFFEGKLRVVGSEDQVGGLVLYLGKCYQAYPEGSKELAAGQAADAKRAAEEASKNGERAIQTGERGGRDNNLQGQLQPVGTGAEASPAKQQQESDDPDAGQSEHVSHGDGHADAGIPVSPGSGQPSRLRQALSELDPKNDEHWRSDGLPRMDAIQGIYGSGDVSRAAVDAHAPGFVRGTVLE